MWDVLGAGRSGSGGFGTFWGLGGFWTLERVRDVRGALGEADWVWAGCWDVDGLLGGGWYAGGLGEGNKKPGPGGLGCMV